MIKTMWKIITSHPNYEVSTEGQVRNIKTQRILKGSKHTSGYLQVPLYPNYKTFRIHTLVANAFLEKEEGEIDHIDRDKTNNNVNNLRWVLKSENALNKDYRIVKTDGLHNICQITNKGGSIVYKVCFAYNYTIHVEKRFKTVQEAIDYRDEYIKNNPR